MLRKKVKKLEKEKEQEEIEKAQERLLEELEKAKAEGDEDKIAELQGQLNGLNDHRIALCRKGNGSVTALEVEAEVIVVVARGILTVVNAPLGKLGNVRCHRVSVDVLIYLINSCL